MKQVAIILIGIVLLTSLFQCTSKNNESGIVKLTLTDAPFPADMVQEAMVTIFKIEIRNAADSVSSFLNLSSEEQPFNLLELSNGITATIAELEIPSGKYNQIRLYVKDASVKLTDGTVYDLKIPGGFESGVKLLLKPAVEITDGDTTELILDFDVSKSFKVQGNPDSPAGIKGFIFSPVVRTMTASVSGSISGTVSDEDNNKIKNASISIITQDSVLTSTFTNGAGKFKLIGIEKGTYNLQVEKEGYITSLIENIDIKAGQLTNQNIVLVK
jgi:hypothetical protein